MSTDPSQNNKNCFMIIKNKKLIKPIQNKNPLLKNKSNKNNLLTVPQEDFHEKLI